MNTETKVVIGVLVLTAAVIIGIVALGGKSAPAPIDAKQVDNGQVIRSDSHKIGADDTKVKLVEFGDYQCPACGQAYPILKQIVADRGSKIQFVFRNFPLSSIHQNADNAARAAEAAALQNKYWEMHDKLYETQTSWENSTSAKDVFSGYAKDLGLNTDQFGKDYDSQKVVDTIAQDKGDGNALGVDATPTIYINGDKYTGDVSVQGLESKIDSLL